MELVHHDVKYHTGHGSKHDVSYFIGVQRKIPLNVVFVPTMGRIRIER